MHAICCALLAMLSATSAGAAPAGVRGPAGDAVVPGEYEAVEEVIVAWEPDLSTYQLDVIARASEAAPVRVLVAPEVERADLDAGLAALLDSRGHHSSAHRIAVTATDVDSVWLRDYGPVVVRSPQGERTFVDFRYFGAPVDDEIPRGLAQRYGARLDPVDLEFEGGNLLADGRGRCIVSRLLFETNPQLSRRQTRQLFRERLGCRTLTAVPYLEGEETRHVDMFAAVSAAGHVLVGRYDALDDPVNARRLDQVARQLRRAGFDVVRVPMPDNRDGLFRTYLNITPVNGSVLVPVYDLDTRYEREALDVIGAAYPGRLIVPIVADEIIELQGSVRCSTGVIPASR